LLSIAGNPAWRNMDRVRCLSRALELARATRDAARQEAVVVAMLAFADQDLASDDGGRDGHPAFLRK
jgi:hypothetical protein